MPVLQSLRRLCHDPVLDMESVRELLSVAYVEENCFEVALTYVRDRSKFKRFGTYYHKADNEVEVLALGQDDIWVGLCVIPVRPDPVVDLSKGRIVTDSDEVFRAVREVGKTEIQSTYLANMRHIDGVRVSKASDYPAGKEGVVHMHFTRVVGLRKPVDVTVTAAPVDHELKHSAFHFVFRVETEHQMSVEFRFPTVEPAEIWCMDALKEVLKMKLLTDVAGMWGAIRNRLRTGERERDVEISLHPRLAEKLSHYSLSVSHLSNGLMGDTESYGVVYSCERDPVHLAGFGLVRGHLLRDQTVVNQMIAEGHRWHRVQSRRGTGCSPAVLRMGRRGAPVNRIEDVM